MGIRYILTGGTGYLGKIIATSLQKDHEIALLGRSPNSDLIVESIAKPFALPPVSQYDIVIHAAGKAHVVPRSESERKEFFEVNFDGTKHLCNAVMTSNPGLKAFVFISTVAVYGIDQGEAITEDQPLQGITPYAKSKIIAEEWLQEWAAKNSVILSILRLPLVAGPNPPGNLGAMINGIRSGKYLSIGKANAKKSVVWAEDVAKIIPKAVEVGGIFNLTDGRHPSFAALEQCIAGALKRKKPPSFPIGAAKLLAYIGDMLGSSAPINSEKLRKITSTLTFDDQKARGRLDWRPASVIEKLPTIL